MSEPEASTFLDDVAAALTRRQKPIKYRLRKLRRDRINASEYGPYLDKLEIECVLLTPRTTLRVNAWEDRWVWVDAHQSSKAGRVWQFRREGRLVGDPLAFSLVAALEASIGVTGDEARLSEIWTPILAQGPKQVA